MNQHLIGHTERRYQRRSCACRFCDRVLSEDSIEHFVECAWVNSCFPAHLKVGSPPKVPKAVFFLDGLAEVEKVVVAIFNFALYTLCNELRHTQDRADLTLTLKRIMGEVYMRPAVLNAWQDFFGFRPCTERRETR